MDVLWFYFNSILRCILQMLFNDFRGNGDNMLALPILDQVQRLQGTDDIFRLDGRHIADIFDGEITSMFA